MPADELVDCFGNVADAEPGGSGFGRCPASRLHRDNLVARQ
jgi:hypothetical protein